MQRYAVFGGKQLHAHMVRSVFVLSTIECNRSRFDLDEFTLRSTERSSNNPPLIRFLTAWVRWYKNGHTKLFNRVVLRATRYSRSQTPQKKYQGRRSMRSSYPKWCGGRKRPQGEVWSDKERSWYSWPGLGLDSVMKALPLADIYPSARRNLVLLEESYNSSFP